MHMLDAFRDILHHVTAGVNQTHLETPVAKTVKSKVSAALSFLDERLRNTQHKVYGKQVFSNGETVDFISPGGLVERVVVRDGYKNHPLFEGLNMYHVERRVNKQLFWVCASDLRICRGR